MPSVAVNPPKTPVTKGSKGIAAATVPNVCKMPGPPAPFVPVPLPNIGKSGSSPKKYSKTVKIEKQIVAIKGASYASQGDIASKGTGGGLISSNTHGPTKFIAPGAIDVKIEGKNVQLLGDAMLNNGGPSGSPPNSATMAGTMQGGVHTVPFFYYLMAVAKKCNADMNKKLGHCPGGGPSGSKCTTSGTSKHTCCERQIKEDKANGRVQGIESEVSFDTKHNVLKNRHGAHFIADVLIPNPKGGYMGAYDFKFSCKPQGTVKATAAQNNKYRNATGHYPDIIHIDGSKC